MRPPLSRCQDKRTTSNTWCRLTEALYQPDQTQSQHVARALALSKLRRRNLKNGAFFYTLFLNEFGAFRKRSSNRRNLKTLALRFSMDGKHLSDNDNVTIVMIFNCQSFTRCSVFKFLWTENIWWVFRVKHPFSKSSGIVWIGLCYELRLLSKLFKVFQQRIASRRLV